jgi:hypothetical protein
VAPLYDAAWLVQRLRRELRRPQNDQALSKDVAYEFLTEAQDDVFRMISSIAPEENYGAPVLLTSADGGRTYTFGNDADGDPIEPLGHVELYPSLTGLPMVGGAWFDPNADYVFEGGNTIRFPLNKQKLFGGVGPYARFAIAPPPIDDDHEPTLKPVRARILIVHRAAAKWAAGPGKSDPARHNEEFRRAWLGVPEDGIPGLVASLKTRQMAQAAEPGDGNWWDFIDTGEGYQRYG